MTLDDLKRKREEEERKSRARLERALRLGAVLVQVSPRRYLVVRISGWGMANGLIAGHGRRDGYWAHADTTTVYGPASYQECWNWIVSNTDPVPAELLLADTFARQTTDLITGRRKREYKADVLANNLD